MKKLLFLVLTTGCSPARLACYADSDARYTKAVDACIEQGLTEDSCPWLKQAKLDHAAEDRRCP